MRRSRSLNFSHLPRLLRRRNDHLVNFKQGVANTLLITAARLGQRSIIVDIAAGRCGVPVQINTLDCVFGRSPLFWAVHRRQYAVVKLLLDLGASPELRDGNRMPVLALAAHLGDARLVKMLVDNGAPLGLRDILGLTPLHYASFLGHDRVVAVLAAKLIQLFPGSTVDCRADVSASDDSLTCDAEGGSTTPGDVASPSASKTILSRRVSRRQSLISSVRSLLTSRSRSVTLDGAANPSQLQVSYLSNVDISPFSALDPLTLSGFTEIRSAGRRSLVAIGAAGLRAADLPHGSRRQSRTSLAANLAESLSAPRHSGQGWSLPSPGNFPRCVAVPTGLRELPSPALRLAAAVRVPSVSPLTLAVHARHRGAASLLLRHGGNPTLRDGTDLSPYERALFQHRTSSQLCDALLAFQDGDAVEDVATAKAGFWSVLSRFSHLSQRGRVGLAVVRAVRLIDGELQRLASSAPSTQRVPTVRTLRALATVPHKSAADYADDLDSEAVDKPSRWNVVRERIADIVRLGRDQATAASSKVEPSLTKSLSLPLQTQSILFRRKPAESATGPGVPKLQGSDAPPEAATPSGDLNDDASRVPHSNSSAFARAERDRLATLERARSKALRSAKLAESNSIGVLDCLSGTASVQNRRWTFAMCTLAKVRVEVPRMCSCGSLALCSPVGGSLIPASPRCIRFFHAAGA